MDNAGGVLLTYSDLVSDFSDICIAILAAGESRRMGTSKLTMPFAGSTLLERVMDAAEKSVVGKAVVITGSHRLKTRPLVSCRPSMEEIYNARWREGQSTSVVMAIEYGIVHGFAAVLLVVADQPFVGYQHINRLVEEYKSSASEACVARVADRDGSPCLFAQKRFDDLLVLRGDQGARKAYRDWPEECVTYVTFDDPRLFYDVDTSEDVRQLEEMIGYG